MAARVLVGLGNPGRRYRGTRHNLGFAVVERVAAAWNVALAEEPLARVGSIRLGGGRAVLVMPLTYVNRSGAAARVVSERFRAAPADVLVVLDDLHLPLGHLRLRARGSAGGHRGLASVLLAFGTEAVPRLRVGIGSPPPGVDPADFVLDRFRPDEEAPMAAALEAAAAAARAWLEGAPAEELMNRINRRVSAEPEPRTPAEGEA